MRLLTADQIESFTRFMQNHDTFLIAGHKEPDGDCVSCCIAMSKIAAYYKKAAVLLNAGPFKRTEISAYAPLFRNSVPFMSQPERDVCGLIIVDCSELSRLGEIDGDLAGLDTFIVDHHRTAQVSGTGTIIDATAPAAACIVQQLYEATIGSPSAEDAHTLFFGLGTDTGFFRFLQQDSAEAFKAAARLVEAGANPREIYNEITAGKTWNTRKLLALMLTRAERHCSGKLVVTWETIEDTRTYGQNGRDSDALYSALLATSGVEAVLFLRQETEHNCTAGFRSRDKCDVSAIAAKFGGGGHKNASGASIEGRIETLLPAIIKEFAKVL